MNKFFLATRKFLNNEEGVTAIEYGLIAALIAVGIIVAVTAIGGMLKEQFKLICSTLKTGIPTSAIVCPT
jgi:pilus assembly protein Flp/PilA